MRSFILAFALILAVAGTAAAAGEYKFDPTRPAGQAAAAGQEMTADNKALQMAIGVQVGCGKFGRGVWYDREPAFKDDMDMYLFRSATCSGYEKRIAQKYGTVSMSAASVSGGGQTIAFSPANYCVNIADFEKVMSAADYQSLAVLLYDLSNALTSPGDSRLSPMMMAGTMGGAQANWDMIGEMSVHAAVKGITGQPLQRFVSAITVGNLTAARRELEAARAAAAAQGSFCQNMYSDPIGQPLPFDPGAGAGRGALKTAPADDQAAATKTAKKAKKK